MTPALVELKQLNQELATRRANNMIMKKIYDLLFADLEKQSIKQENDQES